MIDHPDITNAELHRRDLQRVAARIKPRPENAPQPDGPAATPLMTERQRLLSSLDEMWRGSARAEVERADPLGTWSLGPPRRPRARPDLGAVLDWGTWTLLIALAGYVLAGR